MSAEYGRRARVTAGDLKQIMQAQADAFFGISSQIAALHEHVEMLKERYLREVRREFRNTNNQRELTENGRRNMSRWERGGDLGDRDPFKRRMSEMEEEKRVWEFEDKVKRNLNTVTGMNGSGLQGLIQLNSSSNKNNTTSSMGMNFGSGSSMGMSFGNNNNNNNKNSSLMGGNTAFGSSTMGGGGGMSFGGGTKNNSNGMMSFGGGKSNTGNSMSFGGSGNSSGGMTFGGTKNSSGFGSNTGNSMSFGGKTSGGGGGLSFGGNTSSGGLSSSFGGGGGGGGLKFGG